MVNYKLVDKKRKELRETVIMASTQTGKVGRTMIEIKEQFRFKHVGLEIYID